MRRLFIAVVLLAFGCAGSVSEITGEQAPAQVQTEKEPVKPEKSQPEVAKKTTESVQEAGQPQKTTGELNGQPAPTQTSHVQAASVDDAINQAASAVKNGDLQTAERILEPVAETNPVAKCNLAVLKYRQGLYADAARLARDALDSLKSGDKCLRVLFAARLAQRDYNGLANFLYTYKRQHPKSVTAANLSARLLIFQGKPSEAVRQAKLVLKMDETNVDVMKTLAMGYMAMKRYDAAKFVIAQIQDIKSDDPDALDLLANILVKTGKRRAAIPLFLKALEKEPGLYDARIQLGILYMEAGDYEGAEAQLRAAIKLFPGRVDAYLNLGTVLTKMLKFDEARRVLKKALDISPDNPIAYFNLGVLEMSDKPADFDRPEHYRKAIAWFKKYQEHAGYVSSDDPVFKYMTEAKRMAKKQEMILEQMKQTPQEPAAPAPDNQQKNPENPSNQAQPGTDKNAPSGGEPGNNQEKQGDTGGAK